jgi:hypothetical protein
MDAPQVEKVETLLLSGLPPMMIRLSLEADAQQYK